jgi:hypothetical protein
MKTVLLIAFVSMTVIPVAAQATDIVKSFQQNKLKYTREHFVSGEDASSGFDYLFYKDGVKIIMIRSIWSATHTRELRIDDAYYSNGTLVVFRRLLGNDKQLKALIRGRTLPLTQKEEIRFSGSKLVSWTEKGKPVATTDPRWAETEKFILEHGTSLLESYDWLKEDK